MRKSSTLLIAASLVMLLPPLAFAGECDPVPVSGFVHEDGAVDEEHIGDTTRAWLNMQCSGQAAGGEHAQTEAAAKRAYQRYVDSFGHPLPEFFQQQPFAKGSSGK